MSSEAIDQPVVDVPMGVDAGVVTDAPATDDLETGAAESGADADIEYDDDGYPIEAAPAPTVEEIEFEADDGTKLKVPKTLEKALLRQADYTKKTQELADQRRAVEAQQSELAAQASQQAESLKAFRTEHMAVAAQEATLADIEKELASYRQYTPAAWAATKAENPGLYQQHAERLDFLRLMRTTTTDALEAAKSDLTAKEATFTERQTAAERAKLNDGWQQVNTALAKEIPDWSPPWQPGKGQEIAAFVNKEFGITAEQISKSTDPVAWKMANALMEARAKITKLEANQKQSTATNAALKSQVASPAAVVKGGSRPPATPRDDMDIKAWVKAEEARMARKAAR